MATLYTEKDREKALKELRIEPEEGKWVDGNEAARILTWRAMQEQQISRQYETSSLREHVKKGNFPAGSVKEDNPRRNLYLVEAVFRLRITPRRGLKKKSA